jgi:PHD/YefM family antitoxin component YafN of YafNO toxin-antitoxin module
LNYKFPQNRYGVGSIGGCDAMGVWQSSMARGRLAEIVDQAVGGAPQFIQRRDGKEVVVVSREYFDCTKPNLKTFLLNEGVAGAGEEEFDAIMRDIRGETDGAYAVRWPAREI